MVLQDFKLAKELKNPKLVLALRGHSQAEDKTGFHFIVEGIRVLQKRPSWKIYDTPKHCNTTAHSIVKWAKSLNCISPEILNNFEDEGNCTVNFLTFNI